MLLIVAGAWDEVAQALAAKWNNERVRLLTPLDLSRKGWRWRAGVTRGNSGVIRRESLDLDTVSGVLVRLPAVHEGEIPHIVPQDRSYVAAEMHAFLFALLSGLRCLVLNRPRASCLSGPPWRNEQWIHLAAQIGLSVRPVRLVASLSAEQPNPIVAYPDASEITLVGDDHVGVADPLLVAQAHRLAAAAGVDLLTVFFSNARSEAEFIGASLWPNVADPAVGDLVLRCLSRGYAVDQGVSS